MVGGDTAGDGRGLRFAGSVAAERVIVRGNRADLDGGGLASGGGAAAVPSLAMKGSIVSLNSAGQDGGGSWIGPASTTSVTHSIVIANSAARSGGGLMVTGVDVPVRIDQTTIYGNNGGTTPPAAPASGVGHPWATGK